MGHEDVRGITTALIYYDDAMVKQACRIQWSFVAKCLVFNGCQRDDHQGDCS